MLPSITSRATSFSSVKPKCTASGRNSAGSTISLTTVATAVGFKYPSALRPLKPAPMASRARGLVRPATLERALSSMAGMEMCSMLHPKPAAMPRRMGFVRMPFTLFLSFSAILPV